MTAKRCVAKPMARTPPYRKYVISARGSGLSSVGGRNPGSSAGGGGGSQGSLDDAAAVGSRQGPPGNAGGGGGGSASRRRRNSTCCRYVHNAPACRVCHAAGGASGRFGPMMIAAAAAPRGATQQLWTRHAMRAVTVGRRMMGETETHACRAAGVGVRGAGQHGIEHVHEAVHDMCLCEAVLLSLRILCPCVHVAAQRRSGSAQQAAQVLANWNCSQQREQKLLRTRPEGDAHACTQRHGSGSEREEKHRSQHGHEAFNDMCLCEALRRHLHNVCRCVNAAAMRRNASPRQAAAVFWNSNC